MTGMPPNVDFNILQQHNVDAKSLMSTITAIVDAHPDPQLKDSLVAHLTANAQPIHTPSKTANTNIFVTVADTNSDEIYMLMGQKYKDQLRPELGLDDKLSIIDGYIDPADNNAPSHAAENLKAKTKLELPDGFKPEMLAKSDKDYHINMYGSISSLPKVEAQNDIGALHWVKASTMLHDETIGVQPHNSNISRFTAEIINPKTGNTLPIYIEDHIGEALVKAIGKAKETLQFLHENPEGHKLYTASEPSSYGNDTWPAVKKDEATELQNDFHEKLTDHYEEQSDRPAAPELANLTDSISNGALTAKELAMRGL